MVTRRNYIGTACLEPPTSKKKTRLSYFTVLVHLKSDSFKELSSVKIKCELTWKFYYFEGKCM